MLHTIFIKCKEDVMYFIFIFRPSIPRFSVKKSVNQLIKNKRPKLNSKYHILPNTGASVNTKKSRGVRVFRYN